MQQLVNNAGLGDEIWIDSAGTGGWHVGERAHGGTRKILQKHSIPYNGRSHQIDADDYSAQDTYLIAMDDSNRQTLVRRFGPHPNLHKLLDFASATNETNVPDPYYSGGFDYVYTLVDDGCTGLLVHLRKTHNL